VPSEFTRRLEALVIEAGGNVRAAELAGVSSAATSGWRNGADPQVSGLLALLRSLGVSANWLLFGTGEKYGGTGTSSDYAAGDAAGYARAMQAIAALAQTAIPASAVIRVGAGTIGSGEAAIRADADVALQKLGELEAAAPKPAASSPRGRRPRGE
jgi:zona occludens toxin (predicted ATPase)